MLLHPTGPVFLASSANVRKAVPVIKVNNWRQRQLFDTASHYFALYVRLQLKGYNFLVVQNLTQIL